MHSFGPLIPLFFALFSFCCSTTVLPPTAVVKPGPLVGTTTSLPSASAPVNKFLGVPFAQSPPERFAPPKPPKFSSKPLKATAFKPACLQQIPLAQSQSPNGDIFNSPPSEESEDCLYLNVFVPSTPPPPGGRAVMFWIYGGGFTSGNAGVVRYDGSAFAAYQDIIVVTPNYRTNVFGFAGSPEIPPDQQNLGLLDQRRALDWVKQNIESFGGSPDKVTIAGESAGAISVDYLITSYPNAHAAPFRGAILESGQNSYPGLPAIPNQPNWFALAAALNCSTHYPHSNLTCLREASADTIKNTIDSGPFVFQPVVDGHTQVGSPALARSQGKFADVPILIGTNANEGRLFTPGQNDLNAFYQQPPLNVLSPDQIDAINASYTANRRSNPYGGNIDEPPGDYYTISAIYTDLVFQCPAALFANQTTRKSLPVWRYLYAGEFPNEAAIPNGGAFHSVEIDIVFQTYPGGPVKALTPKPEGGNPTNVPPTDNEKKLSKEMNKIWGDFVKDPSGGLDGYGKWKPDGSEVKVFSPDGKSGGDIIADRATVDFDRCPVFYPVYRDNAAVNGPQYRNLPGLD